jgi:two-component system response regulator DevR
MIRLLIIDDHEIVREGLKTILTSEPDFEVVGESGSADQLVDLVERTQPDIVLLDARLPGTGGSVACRRLCESHPDVDVLIVSSYDDDELVDECIRAGAKGYVIKDMERFALKQSIRAVHRGEAALSPAVTAHVLNRVRGKDRTATSTRPALSASQIDILRLISKGLSNREIAERIHVSENTVKSHVQEIFRKLAVRNRVEAALLATSEGLI